MEISEREYERLKRIEEELEEVATGLRENGCISAGGGREKDIQQALKPVSLRPTVDELLEVHGAPAWLADEKCKRAAILVLERLVEQVKNPSIEEWGTDIAKRWIEAYKKELEQ
jgi:hypothetical protein